MRKILILQLAELCSKGLTCTGLIKNPTKSYGKRTRSQCWTNGELENGTGLVQVAYLEI